MLTVWSLNQKTVLRRFGVPNSIDCVSASRDASVLIIASGPCVSLYRAFSVELLVQFVYDFDVLSAEFTPDSRWIMLVGHNELVFQQVSGGCARHSHKFEGGSIMAIASASGRCAVLNFSVSDDETGHNQLYGSGDAGYGTLFPAQGILQTVLSR